MGATHPARPAPFTWLLFLLACGTERGSPPTGPPVGNAAVRLEARVLSSEAVGVVGTTLSDDTFGVFAHDGTSPISGLPIVWAVTGSGGSVTPTHDTTRGGESIATLTLGADEGRYTVTATAPTLPDAPQITFKATAVTLMVGIRDLLDGGFVPASVTVPSGRSVGWRYESAEGDLHNITFEDDPTRPVNFADIVGGRRGHTRTFGGTPRTIRYRCTLHSTGYTQGEVGTVIVQ